MRKLFVFSLIFTILFTQVAYALPVPGTPGNANYVEPDSDYIESDMDFIDTYATVNNIPGFSNTVTLKNVQVIVQYYTMSGNLKSAYLPLDSSGHFAMDRPDDFASLAYLHVSLNSGALPSAGKYKVQCLLNPEGGGSNNYLDPSIGFNRKRNNSANVWENTAISKFLINYSQAYWEATLDLGFVTSMSFICRASDFNFGFNGHVKIAFTELSSGSSTDITSPGAGSASEDIQQGIQDNTSQVANNTGELVSGQREIMDTLKDIVQTISYQLEAFWLQLAHEFTNLYNKMNEQHAELIQAIQDGFNVTIINKFEELIENNNQNTNQIIDNNNQNHQEQIDNDNKNTDTIVNGYDNSGLNQSNQNLSDTLNKYQEEEDKLLADTKDKIEDFEFQNPFDTFVAPLEDVAYFLNGIYITLGSFNIPIGFSLTLTIALLCIGWYRFRGGG